jgi:L,D-peptidoglycan transpeptidase YkuD (ErfK/YbiS/YcfS/YnhG family)
MIYRATSDGVFLGPRWRTACVLGRSGVVSAEMKREGDGASPLGVWPIRRVLYRADRGPPPRTALAASAIGPDDGWCDAPGDVAYNRPVRLPYPASAERLFREDHVYDLIVVLGHNDDPVRDGMGSAIFLHLMRPERTPTEGCVALLRGDLDRVLAEAVTGDAIEIAKA